MIDLLLKLADRLIQLLSLRSEDRRSTLDDLIEPIFSDVLAIHTDYSAMFYSVRDLAGKHGVTVMQLRESLMERRRELEHVRNKVRAIAIEANPILERHSLPKEADAFFFSVCGYLGASFTSGYDARSPSGRREPKDDVGYFPVFHNWFSPSSASSTLFDALHVVDSSTEDARHTIGVAIASLEESWKAVLQSYAHARIALRK